jgi:hypothetical protein
VFLDALKDFGFRYSTQGGVSVGIEDMEIPPEKDVIIREAEDDVARFTRAYKPTASSPTASATTRSSTPGRTPTTTWRTPWWADSRGRETASTRCT